MERYKDIRALALLVPQHGRFLAGCGERWRAFYRTAWIVGRGRGEGNGNRRREGRFSKGIIYQSFEIPPAFEFGEIFR
ncbi:hypothetical protein L1049_018635 [Liquidambar formosana]|uniref:Uncharacterized protein n=1 Tax=Liquidambar formosana TaxID=63359 RepID=A0AAP0RAC6_LIQFO